MKNHIVHALVGIMILLTAMVSQGTESEMPYPPPPVAGNQQYSEPQLEQLLAPIALYSDPLLAQILWRRPIRWSDSRKRIGMRRRKRAAGRFCLRTQG